MPGFTISLSARTHRALKEASVRQGRSMGAIIEESLIDADSKGRPRLVTLGFLATWSPSWLSPDVNRLLMLLDPSGFRWLDETFLVADRGAPFYNAAPLVPDAGILNTASRAPSSPARRSPTGCRVRAWRSPMDGRGRFLDNIFIPAPRTDGGQAPVASRIPFPAAGARIGTRPSLPGEGLRVEDPPKENEQEQLPRALTTGRSPP